MTGIAVLYLVVAIFVVLVYAVREGILSWFKWYKSGFCSHEWELHNTCSFGQKHWYKCTKCDEKRLR